MEKIIKVCIGTDVSGNIRVRLSLIQELNGREMFHHFHSINVEPSHNLDEVRRIVEQHIGMPEKASGIPFGPWPRISETEWDKVIAVCDIFQPTRKLV